MSTAAIDKMFQKVEGSLRNDADSLAIAIHTCLDAEGFRLVGVGEDAQATGKDLATVPRNWNEADDVYTFTYRHSSSAAIFFFKLLVVDDVLVLHGVSDKSEDLHILELRPADYVQFLPAYVDAKQFSKIFTETEQLFRSIKINVVAKLLPVQQAKQLPKDCSTQARDSREREDNFRGGLAYPDVGRSDFMPGNVPSPFGVGSGGFGGGGGNLVGPRNPGFGGWGGMGVGGPRFDPIGPPGLRPPGGLGGLTGGPGGSRFPPGFGGDPDNDLFRPPTGRGDDMFL